MVEAAFLKTVIQSLALPEAFIDTVNDHYLPLARHLTSTRHEQPPVIIGINGLQGTGKTTLSYFLKLILEKDFQKKVVSFSIDDFYLTHLARQKLAQTIHPLLGTRGVPGTHDYSLLSDVFEKLKKGERCLIPVFDKALDDRAPEEQWQQVGSSADIILFDGWCVGSTPQNQDELDRPVNSLEQRDDSNGVWRRYANDMLTNYQENIFNQLHMLIMLQPPGFESVFAWRKLQENKLRESSSVDRMANRIMDDSELQHFIQHYERISRHSLSTLPDIADVCIKINAQHDITQVVYRE